MIKEFKKSIGYICPICSEINIKDLTIFDFSGRDAASFACADANCAEPCIKITTKKDNYTISVECPLCDDTHIFNIRRATFWQNDFFVLNCPETDAEIFFVGTHGKVQDEIQRQEQMLTNMQDEISGADKLTVIFEIVERINELAKAKNVKCHCGNSIIAVNVSNESITLTCRRCGHVSSIATTSEELNRLLKASAIVLE